MKKSGIIIAVLLVIIIALIAYIIKVGNTLYEKEITENRGILVLDDVNIEEDGKLENVILKVKNISSEVINNKKPVLIYYDNNNMPIHEAWGARVGYFAPGEERCIEFYDVISEYAKVEVGFFESEDKVTYTDLRDKVIYNVEKATESDENGEITKYAQKDEYGNSFAERRRKVSGKADCHGRVSPAHGRSGEGKTGKRTGNPSALGRIPGGWDAHGTHDQPSVHEPPGRNTCSQRRNRRGFHPS